MSIYNPDNCPFEIKVHYGECQPIHETAVHIAKWWEIFLYRLFGKKVFVETPQGKVVGYKFRGGTLLHKINLVGLIDEWPQKRILSDENILKTELSKEIREYSISDIGGGDIPPFDEWINKASSLEACLKKAQAHIEELEKLLETEATNRIVSLENKSTSEDYYEWPQKGQVSSSDQGVFLQPVGSHDSNPFDPPYKEIQNEHRHDWSLFAQESVTGEFTPKIYARCKDLKCDVELDEEQIVSRINDYSNFLIELKNAHLSSYEKMLDGIIKTGKELRERDETLQYLKEHPIDE